MIELVLPVEPRFTWPHPSIDAVRGQVAVESGPLVLALEDVDLPDGVKSTESQSTPLSRRRARAAAPLSASACTHHRQPTGPLAPWRDQPAYLFRQI